VADGIDNKANRETYYTVLNGATNRTFQTSFCWFKRILEYRAESVRSNLKAYIKNNTILEGMHAT